MLKIVTILGARPQFIKAGSVSREIAKYNNIQEIIVHTGQHYDIDMSDIFFEEMDIRQPDYFLNIGAKSHGAMVGQMIEKIEEILIQEEPNWVLVYGDTNSTLAGAIAASKLNIKVAHVEAGLRSFNMQMPEEINRILTDRVSSALFTPTQIAVENLNNEGISNWKTNAKVINVGDVMQDGANFYKNFAKKPNNIEISDKYILCTIHRAENTDNPNRLNEIMSALNEISKNIQIILPLHPRTKKILQNSNIEIKNLNIINPVGYINMVWLIKNCEKVMTDSGGLQKEAYFFSKACITMRDETEWVELVKNNYNILVGANKNKIIDAYKTHKFSNTFNQNLYGGEASRLIIKYLLKHDS